MSRALLVWFQKILGVSKCWAWILGISGIPSIRRGRISAPLVQNDPGIVGLVSGILGISKSDAWILGISGIPSLRRGRISAPLVRNDPGIAGVVSGILGISKSDAWILGISGIPSLFVDPMKANLGFSHSK